MGSFNLIRRLLLLVLALSAAAVAQIKLGPNVDLSGNGTVAAGYSGSYGDQIGSSHGLTLGGTGVFTGDYYDPKFLSFHVSPYFNQSRSNSDIQSVTNASGVDAGANIFGGSHFPGYVAYTDTYNKTTNNFTAGQPDFVTNGSGQAFSLAWSEELPDEPSVTAGYTKGDSNYSVYGSDQRGNSNYQNFYANSQYRIVGFNLSGGFSLNDGHANIPVPYTGQSQSQISTSNNRSYNFAASHLLPMQGGASLSYNRNDLNSDYLGYSFKGSIDTVSLTTGFYPKKNWNISSTATYSDNLDGQIYEAVVPTTTPTGGATGTVTGTQLAGSEQTTNANSQSSHSWDLIGTTSYAFPRYLIVSAQASRREQLYEGKSYSSDSVGGGGLYTHPLAGGFLNANLFVSDTHLSYSSENALGLLSNVSYARRAGAWDFTVGGSYNQNMQTLLISYTTSNYTATANVGRRFGHFVWHGGASLGRSALTAQPDTSYSSQSYSTGFGYRGYSLQGSYSKSDGNGLATGGGTSSTPLPPVIPPELLILYGGKSYSGTFSGALATRLTFSATYLKSDSNTTSNAVFSSNSFEEESVQLQYRFRKMGFTGGYTRLEQGFSASGLPSASTSTFSVSIYRWFNFF